MVHVLCFGNLWQGDDGFGIHVCRRLQAQLHEGAMRVFEVGLRGLDALPLFEGCEQAILVDALHEPATPAGTVRMLTAADIPADAGGGTHTASVNYLLQALAASQAQVPPIILIGAVAGTITPFSDTLSPALARALAPVANAVMQHIAAVGEQAVP